jgi:hypothetical protein
LRKKPSDLNLPSRKYVKGNFWKKWNQQNDRRKVLKVLVPVLRERIGECEITDHECLFYYTLGTKMQESLKKKGK